MADVSAPTPPRRPRAPQWLFEGIDLIDQRRRALLITFGFIVVVASVIAFVRPAILPPTPVVGAAIGLAALLLATAVLIALDTADLKVRGARHVRAAGGELVAVLPTQPSPLGAADLAEAIEEVRPRDRTLLLGMAAATGDGRRIAHWADEVARSLAQRGTSVLSLDLTAPDDDQAGFVEVVRDGAKLGTVVDLDPEIRLARLGPGRDASEALRAFPGAGRWIPRDLEVLVVALPMAASRAVVRASLSLDQLLIVAERDRTSRVELIAGLDATETVGTHSQVILIDDAYASYLGVAVAAEDGSPDRDVVAELQEDPSTNGPPRSEEPVEPEPADPEAAVGTRLIGAPTSTGGHDQGPEAADPPAPPDHVVVEEEDVEPVTEEAAEPVALDEGPEPDGGVSEAAVLDHDDAGARDVDVMMGAAAASALASVAAYDERVDEAPAETIEPDEQPDLDDAPGSKDPTDELTARISSPSPIEEDETTDEVQRPAADARGDDPEPAQEQDEDEDLLNTTARLSLLMDDLGEREEGEQGPYPRG